MIFRDEVAVRALELLLKHALASDAPVIDEKKLANEAFAIALAMVEAKECIMSDPQRKKL